MITQNNFYVASEGLFSPCDTPDREPDFISGTDSAYWYEGEYLVRRSDHWGRVAACFWALSGHEMNRERTVHTDRTTARCKFARMEWVDWCVLKVMPWILVRKFPEHEEEIHNRYNATV